MPLDRDYNLAIETSAQCGSVCLGRGDEILGSMAFAHSTKRPSKGAELMPCIESICGQHGVDPDRLGQVYVSIGPGSFTGLRIGVTTAKLLAMVTGLQIVAVPTIHAVALNAPDNIETVAVCLNLKRQTVYSALFQRDSGVWNQSVEPGLMTMRQVLDQTPRPITILGQVLPPIPQDVDHIEQITVLDGDAALPQAESVYRLGRKAARRNEFVEPFDLVPLYVRRPEAVELWDKRHGSDA